jgi:hypothetical protein
MAAANPKDLEELLNALDAAARSSGEKVTADEIYRAIGKRSFGPLLLTCGLLGLTPISTAPGAPTTLAVVVMLVAGQLLVGRQTLWLPGWLLRRSVETRKLKAAVKVARKPARVVDRLVGQRLRFLTARGADRLVAFVCMLVAALTPPLEFLPFATFAPASVITVFGLGLVACDGLLILIALAGSLSVLGLLGWEASRLL